MAVAWTRDKVGHGSADVVVRDPVAVTASAPRFLTLGDQARLEVDLHNVEGVTGPLSLTVEQEVADGSLTTLAERELTLAANERKSEFFTIAPEHVGQTKYRIVIAGPDGLEIRRSLALEANPPAGDIRRVTVSRLAPVPPHARG